MNWNGRVESVKLGRGGAGEAVQYIMCSLEERSGEIHFNGLNMWNMFIRLDKVNPSTTP
jgi:hypothetical protein